MSEIDVSKCRRYMSIDGCCLASYEENEFGGSWEFCKDKPDCYYKQLQQLKSDNKHLNDLLDSALKENEEIRKINEANANLMVRLRDTLDEIEKYCMCVKNISYDVKDCTPFIYCSGAKDTANHILLDIIKQSKGR